MHKTVDERRSDLYNLLPTWERRTLATHFAVYCKLYRHRTLLITPDSQYSYEEVWHQARQVAKALLALGVRRRDHVAILMANEPEFVFTLIGIALVGAVGIPINTMLRSDELDYVLRQSDSQYLLMHQSAFGVAHARGISERLEVYRESGSVTLFEVVCIPTGGERGDEPIPDNLRSWDSFLERASEVSDAQLHDRWQAGEYPDETACIIYTSGSTGKPKGVMLTHENFLRCSFATCLSRAFEDGRRICTALPLYHVFALEEGLLAASFVGGTIITAPAFVPKQTLELMDRYEANDFLCVPSMLMALLDHPDVANYTWSHMRALMCAAAPAPVPVWERAVKTFGVTELATGYGGTEVTASTLHSEVGDTLARISTRVGRIKPAGSSGLKEYNGANVQYKVVDPDTGEDLPLGAVGELTVRGNIVTRGYYQKPDETAAVIDKDGWFRSGDLGRVDEFGYIELLGRSKDMYKVSGENVAPKEVEDILTAHPAVRQAYVVGVPDMLTTEAGAAFVELRAGNRVTRRELLDWCHESLAKFKIPRHIWFMEPGEWPMTGTGKIQKFRLRDMAINRVNAKEA